MRYHVTKVIDALRKTRYARFPREEDVEKLKKVCAVLEALVQEGEARQAQQGADTDPSSEESIRSMAVSEITEAPIQEQQVAAREAQAAATSKGSARARRERKKYAEGKGLRKGKPTQSQQAKIRKSRRLSREIWLRLHGPPLPPELLPKSPTPMPKKSHCRQILHRMPFVASSSHRAFRSGCSASSSAGSAPVPAPAPATQLSWPMAVLQLHAHYWPWD